MKRPSIITFICIIGFITVVFTFPQMFSPEIKKLGSWVPAFYGLLVAAEFMACIGLWHFKQWGALLFLAALFAKLAFYIVTNDMNFGFYFQSVILIIASLILWRHFIKMNPNL